MRFVEFCEALAVELTPAQRVLCLVAFDGLEPRDLQGDDRELARELFGDVEVIPPIARMVLAVVAGARSGKTYLGALRLVHLAITVPLTMLAPGEQAAAIIVAPDLRLARQAMRFALGAMQSSPDLVGLIDNETLDSFQIRRHDGRVVSVECLPATRGGSAVRGRSLVAALLDEFCFFRDSDAVVNDASVYEAVSPRVVTGGQCVIVSTAWAEAGLLHKFWVEQFGKPGSVVVGHAPTVLMRPDQAERVALEYERDPVNAAREYGAEFIGLGAGAYFDGVSIAACVDPHHVVPLAPAASAHVVAAADFAFTSDHSAIVILRVVDGRAIVADWLEIKPGKGAPLKPSAVCAEFATLCYRHGVEALVADHHAKEAVREHLNSAGIRYQESEGGNAGKLRAYSRAQAMLREQRVKLPSLPRLITQLKEVTIRPLAGGGLQISHARRSAKGHGDLSAALVLALAAAAPHCKGRSAAGRSWRAGAVGKRRLEASTGVRETDVPHGIDRLRELPGGRVGVVSAREIQRRTVWGNFRGFLRKGTERLADFELRPIQGVEPVDWFDPTTTIPNPRFDYSKPVGPNNPATITVMSRLNAETGHPHRNYQAKVGSGVVVKATVDGVEGEIDANLDGRLFKHWFAEFLSGASTGVSAAPGISSVASFVPNKAGNYLLVFHRAEGGSVGIPIDVVALE